MALICCYRGSNPLNHSSSDKQTYSFASSISVNIASSLHDMTLPTKIAAFYSKKIVSNSDMTMLWRTFV